MISPDCNILGVLEAYSTTQKLTLTQYISLIASFFLNSVQTDHSTCEGQSGPVLLLLIAASVNDHLPALRRPAHAFGSSRLKLEKLFRTLLESEPLLALPAWMLSQSSSLNFTPSLSICVCYSGCLWHVYLLAPGCIPFAGLSFHLDSVGSIWILQAGLSLQALCTHRHLIFAFFELPLTSFFYPHPQHTPKASTSRWWKPKSICSCWNFEMSNIYLNKVSHDLRITTMESFCFYNICHKKSIFTINCFKTSMIFFKNANKVSACWGLLDFFLFCNKCRKELESAVSILDCSHWPWHLFQPECRNRSHAIPGHCWSAWQKVGRGIVREESWVKETRAFWVPVPWSNAGFRIRKNMSGKKRGTEPNALSARSDHYGLWWVTVWNQRPSPIVWSPRSVCEQ